MMNKCGLRNEFFMIYQHELNLLAVEYINELLQNAFCCMKTAISTKCQECCNIFIYPCLPAGTRCCNTVFGYVVNYSNIYRF